MRDVEAAVAQYAPPTYPVKLLAHRILLSNLAHLETIAVEAAMRGDGIPGQLEDELFHREVFRRCAELAGGLLEPDEPTGALISYLQGLEGRDSINVLNIVAEAWLEKVFDHLARVEEFIPAVFAMIGEDEARHSQYALTEPVETSERTEEIVRVVEEHLYKIANSANFMLPLVRVLGREPASRMGHDLAVAHEKSCRHLGIEPRVSRIKALARNGRLLMKKEPLVVEDRPWDQIKKRLWDTAAGASQHAFIDIRVRGKTAPAHVQARLLRALGVVYKKHPHLMRVYRNGVTYAPQEPVVGLRMVHHDRDQVGTIFFNPTRYLTDLRLMRMLNRRKRRMDEKDYETYPDVRYLAPLLYPSFATATVSSNGAYGGDFGFGPLNDLEGIGTSLTIGKVRSRVNVDFEVEAFFTLCVTMDHRIGDGKDIGQLAASVKEVFENAAFP